jgi:hypothetical protein
MLIPAIPPATPKTPPVIVPLITSLTGIVLFFIFKPSYLSVGALTNLLIASLANPTILSINPFSTGFGSSCGISTTLSFSCIFSIYFCTSSGLNLYCGVSGGFIISGFGFGCSFIGCCVVGCCIIGFCFGGFGFVIIGCCIIGVCFGGFGFVIIGCCVVGCCIIGVCFGGFGLMGCVFSCCELAIIACKNGVIKSVVGSVKGFTGCLLLIPYSGVINDGLNIVVGNCTGNDGFLLLLLLSSPPPPILILIL